MANHGSITAVDETAWKLEQLRHNAQRQGVTIIQVVPANLLELDMNEWGTFDRVLLDAPCSGFGSLRRNPDIKWRRHPKDPYRFSKLQGELLHQAAQFVKPNGVLVYATCTLLREENEAVVERFASQHPDFVLEEAADLLPWNDPAADRGHFLKTWPHHHDMDGFFAARWRRT
jgi:16S rRNA (cytosine967-C5)-methyltransferase